MSEPVTVVVVPRDRFSGVEKCAEAILSNTDAPFKLVFLDFGYPKKSLDYLRALNAKVPTEVVSFGYAIPMTAFKEYLPRITTPYTAWVDNDTFVAPAWMSPLLELAKQGARAILPTTLEREGLDIDSRGIPLRNHISHSELRRVAVNGRTYVFDYKPYRRAAPEELPQEAHTIDFFELHAFFAETAVLRQIELPPMVVREHIDIGLQLYKLGIAIWNEPKSQVHFDNLNEVGTWRDHCFFRYRWSQRFIDGSHDLFEDRWGYRFLGEQSMKNWAFRRKVFSFFRMFHLPIKICDLMSRGMNKAFSQPPPPWSLGDPLPRSERVMPPRPEAGGLAGGRQPAEGAPAEFSPARKQTT